MPKRQARHDGRISAQEAQLKVRATKERLKPARLSMNVGNEVAAQFEAQAGYRGTSKTKIVESLLAYEYRRLVVEGRIVLKNKKAGDS